MSNSLVDSDGFTLNGISKRYQAKLLRLVGALGINKQTLAFRNSLPLEELDDPAPAVTYFDAFDNPLTVDLSAHSPDTDTIASPYTIANLVTGELEVVGTAGYATAPAADGTQYGNFKDLSGKTLTDGGSFPGAITIPSEGPGLFKTINLGLIDGGSFDGFFTTLDYDSTTDTIELELSKLVGGIPTVLDTLSVPTGIALDATTTFTIDFDATNVTFTVANVGDVTGAHGFAGSTEINTLRFAMSAALTSTPIQILELGEW